MNRFFTLLIAASCLTAVGQEVNDVDCTEVSITVSSGSADYQVSWWLNPQNDQSTSAAGGAPFSANYCLEPGAYSLVGSDAASNGWQGAEMTISWSGGTAEWIGPPYGYGGITIVVPTTGCTDAMACNYVGAATIDGNCIYEGCYGCLNEEACNFDSTSTIDDGSCEFLSCSGCTDLSACNFDPTATLDNGTCYPCDIPSSHCGSGTIWDPTSQTCIVDESACGWQPDGNGDNLIGVNDLLDLLGVYGDTDYDQDDIWDSVDDCVGEYDECGVCNGSGPSIPIIESIEILYDSLYAEQIDEWFVFEVGADTTYQYVCGFGCTDPLAENYNESVDTDDGSCFYPWACGDPLEYQGYDYETVQIGEQCWFAENLRAENYRNGEAIPAGLSDSEWTSTTSGAVTVYGEGESECVSHTPDGDACDELWSYVSFGCLYNWYAVDDTRSLCPNGWEVSSDTDWTDLTDGLGGDQVAGEALKKGSGWKDDGNGSNSSGFSGLPAGSREPQNGNFYDAGYSGSWWTSSSNGEYSWTRYLDYRYSSIARQNIPHGDGFSIRCIKDSE